MNCKVYPFHFSLSYVLASSEAPLYAMRLIREIAFNLDVSFDEVEIIISLAGRKGPTCVTKIKELVPHLSWRKLRTRLKHLETIKAIIVSNRDVGDHYVISPSLALKIKELDKESLQQEKK